MACSCYAEWCGTARLYFSQSPPRFCVLDLRVACAQWLLSSRMPRERVRPPITRVASCGERTRACRVPGWPGGDRASWQTRQCVKRFRACVRAGRYQAGTPPCGVQRVAEMSSPHTEAASPRFASTSTPLRLRARRVSFRERASRASCRPTRQQRRRRGSKGRVGRRRSGARRVRCQRA